MMGSGAASAISPTPQRALAEDLAGPATRSIRRSGAIAAALLAVLVAIATFVPIDSGTLAVGQLAVEGERKVVQHPSGGIVSEILVSEGDVVAEGDVVLRLNAVEAGAAARVIDTQVDALRAEEAARMAEVAGSAEITFPPELVSRGDDPRVAAVMITETSAFEARAALARSQREQLGQQLAQLEQSMSAAASGRAAQQAQAGLLQEELSALQPLLEKGLTVKSRVLSVERALEAAKGEVAALEAEHRRLAAKVQETSSLRKHIDIDRRAEAAEALRRLRAELSAALERQLATADTLHRTEVRAPSAGVVMALKVATVGGVVEAGQPLLEIVPRSNSPVVRARITPREADNVHEGMSAVVRLNAAGASSPATINGVVHSVSADALNDPRTGEAYFEVRIVLPPEEVSRAPREVVAPGLPAEVLIKTGAHTMAEYFFSPVERAMFRALRDS